MQPQQQQQQHPPGVHQNNSENSNSYDHPLTTADFSSPLTTEEQMQNDAFDDIFNGLGGDYYLGFFSL